MRNNTLSLFKSSMFHARIAVISLTTLLSSFSFAEDISIFHVGDQESWLVSAQGNLRDNASQNISFFGGIDRLATTLNTAASAATMAGRSVIKLNAGDAFLPGPRLTASFTNLPTAYNGGQDFYDAIALRQLDFDAIVFGNHEFDLGVPTAARFAEVSETTYLSINLDFTKEANLNALRIAGKVAASKVITTTGGKKIGIIGVTTPLLPTISSPNTLALMNNFAGFSNSNSEAQNLAAVLPVIQAEVNNLRAASPTGNEVDAVIIVSHLQNSNNEINIMVPGLTGIDLVLSGGGHELMADGADTPLITGGVAATYNTHPIFANDASATPVPIVTSHFGNRYVGELRVTIDDTTGIFSVDVPNSRMLRVGNGFAGGGDPTLFANVVTPVSNFLSALNAQIIGTTNVRLNADRAGAGAVRNYLPGIRKSETNMGNIVADAMRFAGNTEVAIQNSGGIRASIAGPGNVTEGDTFNVLTFTNLVKVAPVMNATQLKDILEHGFGGANTNAIGGEEGRYPQVSGIQVIYDSSRPARTNLVVGTGSRIRKITLTKNTLSTIDDVVLVNYGVIVDLTTTFSFTTIDFTAAGGDGYPFIANAVNFINSPFTITYQAALSEYIQTPVVDSGLGHVISSVNNPDYAPQNIFDRQGRIIDMMYASTGRDTINGTTGADLIQGGPGADTINGLAGADIFIYTDVRDALDTINVFELSVDRFDVKDLLESIAVQSAPSALGVNLQFVNVNGGARINYVIPGRPARPLVTVLGTGVNATTLNNASNFIF